MKVPVVSHRLNPIIKPQTSGPTPSPRLPRVSYDGTLSTACLLSCRPCSRHDDRLQFFHGQRHHILPVTSFRQQGSMCMRERHLRHAHATRYLVYFGVQVRSISKPIAAAMLMFYALIWLSHPCLLLPLAVVWFVAENTWSQW